MRYIRQVLEYNTFNPDNLITSRILPPKGYKISNGKLISLEEDDADIPTTSTTPKNLKFGRPLNAYGYYSRQEKQFLNEMAQDTTANLQHLMGKRLAFRWSIMPLQEKKLYDELTKAHTSERN